MQRHLESFSRKLGGFCIRIFLELKLRLADELRYNNKRFVSEIVAVSSQYAAGSFVGGEIVSEISELHGRFPISLEFFDSGKLMRNKQTVRANI
jgi:hypothetical protein